MEKLVIATRRSQLALWQSEYVKAKLQEHYPNMQIELQEFVTKGDKILEAFNKEYKTNIKLEEISTNEIKALIEKYITMGEEVMVAGTPTIFVNKVKDSSKLKYETLGKK